MSVTLDSLLIWPSQGTPAQAKAYVKAHGPLDAFTSQFIDSLFTLAVATGQRFELAFGQWCDETDIGRSKLWLSKRNPGGIGALPDGTYVGIIYKTPEQAALGLLTHLWLYAVGTTLPTALAGGQANDPRWAAVIAAGYLGKATTVKGLASSWATNPAYAVQIVGHTNAAFSGLDEGATVVAKALTFGRVPMPPFIIKDIPTFPGMAMDLLGQRQNHGVVWHRMLGGLEGTLEQFNIPKTGLTDYGIGNGITDGAALDGVIWRYNDPKGKRAGWATGPVTKPWGDGLAFLNEFAWDYNIVNRDQISIELAGMYNTPLTAGQRLSLIKLTAFYADDAKIPYSQFPIWLTHGYSFVRYHQEFTGPDYKVCPGQVVIDATASLMHDISAYMQGFQQGMDNPLPLPAIVYAGISMPSWLKTDMQSGLMKDHTGVLAAERQYTALRDTPRRQVASLKGKKVGPDIKKGATFAGTHLTTKASPPFIFTQYGERILASDLTPEVIIKPRK